MEAGDASPLTDEQLLAAVPTDPAALHPLYDRHARLVYGLALAILRSTDEAADLTQEVFVAMCEPTAYAPERGSVAAFLVTVTRTRAIDRLRRRVRAARFLERSHALAASLPPLVTPCESVTMRRTAERVRTALAELPAPQRQVLQLAYYRGLSQREIADALDIPVGTVKSRARRALTALACALDDLTR